MFIELIGTKINFKSFTGDKREKKLKLNDTLGANCDFLIIKFLGLRNKLFKGASKTCYIYHLDISYLFLLRINTFQNSRFLIRSLLVTFSENIVISQIEDLKNVRMTNLLPILQRSIYIYFFFHFRLYHRKHEIKKKRNRAFRSAAYDR